MELTVPLVTAAAALFLLVFGALIDDRRARARRLVAGAVELPLLHSINDDRCIGCEACVDACPTEVLELVEHKARVVRFSDCVQCEQCANACPTTALVMYRQGGTPQMLTVPELDEHFQTGVPGQYLIGEVAGKPLVKNAANLGRAVIEHIANDLANRPAPSGILDVVIVGSGPGGLSAGLTCKKRGLSAVVLEKEHVISSTVSRYPKGKHFMAEPSNAVNLSYLPVFDASKEELVAAWQRVVEGVQLPIKLGEAVETVKRGDDGIFEVKTTVSTYRSRTVVLATGLRGKPRLLAVPGANLEKVQSRLEDPAEFGGQDVLVVGGGDSAVEAATSLVDAGARVTLSYRGDGFKRCKQGNQKRLAELQSADQLAVLLESNVKEFTADGVAIKLKDGRTVTLPNQQAFVLIGADTPVVWLEANNVRFVEREHLYALGSTEEIVRRVAPGAIECSRVPDEALAVLRGEPVRPSRPPRHDRSVVRRIADELHRTVTELTGVFKIPQLDEPAPRRSGTGSQRAVTSSPRASTRPPRAATGSPVHRTPHAARPPRPQLIPAANLVRAPAPKLFAHRAPVGPVTSSETTLETMSLPAMIAARAAAARPAPPAHPAHPWDDGTATGVAYAAPPAQGWEDATATGVAYAASPAQGWEDATVPGTPSLIRRSAPAAAGEPEPPRMAVGTRPFSRSAARTDAVPSLAPGSADEPPPRAAAPSSAGTVPSRVLRKRLGI